jgi:predicted amidohydrolase YtcJ
MKHPWAALTLLLLGPPAAATSPAPDLILVNGKVFTSEEPHLYAQALAIRGDRIVAVGDSATVEALTGPHTRRLDLKGRVVIPGLNDAHYHLGVEPAGAVEVAVRDMDPPWSEVREGLAARAKATPSGTLLEVRIAAQAFNDLTVDRDALDAVTADHPVMLETLTGHADILNSMALARAGIGEHTLDPVAGRFERDARGRLTGVVREYAVLRVDRNLADSTSDADALRQLSETLSRATRFGITTLQDMSNVLEPGRAVRLLKRLPTPIRVRIMRMPLTTSAGRDTREGRDLPLHPSPLITVSGTKWFLDGVPLEFTLDARASHKGWRRDNFDDLVRELPLAFPESEMRAMLAESLRQNDPLLLHVSGYPAAAAMLGAMEASGGPAVWAAKRVRFEHGDGLLPDLIPRARALGVIVVQNPTHFAVLGDDVFKVSQPVRSLLEAGVPVALGSDNGGGMNPYLNIMLAVVHPHTHAEGITREQAVIAYTRTSAYAEFQETEKGTLAPGKLADLAVLSQDIFTVPLAELPRTTALLTLVGGRIVYDARAL